jgi:hypothetical protein
VLWEGYALYPYRASSLKNRRRLLFGTLVPEGFASAQRANDSYDANVGVLLASGEDAVVDLCIRFLRFGDPDAGAPTTAALAREHAVTVTLPAAGELARFESQHALVVDAVTEDGVRFAALTIGLSARAEEIAPEIRRIHVALRNATDASQEISRDDAELRSLGGAHIVLHTNAGRWVSLLDPPAELAGEASCCARNGLYPVLVGASRTEDTMLASAIILYDHPQVAAESAGDLFDATEIEEILSLRVRTLTDAEKDELKSAEPRVRALLERADGLDQDELMRMHGVLRRAATESTLAVGDHVRVTPKGRADAMDVVLAGLAATVVDVQQTIEGSSLVCVTIDKDPGKDLGEAGFHGHRFFFRPDELERLS